MFLFSGYFPIELRGKERRFRRRVGYRLPRRRVLKFRKVRELRPPAFPDRRGELRPEVAEEEERPRAPPFLAHEEHRDLRREKVDSGDGAHGLRRRERRQPLAEGAVADLVVVLDETDEGGRRQARARLAARASRDAPSVSPW